MTNFFTPFEKFNVLVGGVFGHLTGVEKNPTMENNPQPIMVPTPFGTFDTIGFNYGIYNKGHAGNSFSGYAQADYRWDFCKIIAGLQVNKVSYKDSLGNVDDFDADFNPRAGLIFYPLEHINIKALYSMAYRAPTLNELYLNAGGINGKMRRPVPEDPHFKLWNHQYNLEPEKVNTYDLGVNYQNDKVQAGINGFYSRMHNIISQCLDTSKYQNNTYDNIGKVTIFGLEGEGKYYLTKSILFEGSFLYQQSRDKIMAVANVAPFPNFSAKGGLSYLSEFGLTVGVFNSFQQSVDPKFFDQYGDKTTKHYNMANVHCCYDLNRLFKIHAVKELSLVLNIDNLLNEEVWLPMQVQPLGASTPYDQGRTIYGGFKASF